MSWTLMKLSICSLISSRICTVTRFLRERRAGDLHQLALVQVAGDEQEVDEEQDHAELAEESEESDAAHPEIVGGSEGGLDDLHALDLAAGARRRGSSGPVAASAVFSISLAACCTCLMRVVVVLPLVRRDALADAPRRFRDVGDDRQRLRR